jgi:hypothetical protein
LLASARIHNSSLVAPIILPFLALTRYFVHSDWSKSILRSLRQGLFTNYKSFSARILSCPVVAGEAVVTVEGAAAMAEPAIAVAEAAAMLEAEIAAAVAEAATVEVIVAVEEIMAEVTEAGEGATK